jgi:hypothetical protein
MSASSRASLLFLTALGCVDHLPGLEGTTSLVVEVLEPADLGAEDRRLPSTDRTVHVRVTAKDTHDEIDTGFSAPLDVFTHFLGSLTPDHESLPDLTMTLSEGTGEAVLTLPNAFGPTFLWVEDVRSEGRDATFATGTSPVIWYRDPFLDDVSRPTDEARPDALERSPLEGKQVTITSPRAGAQGRLIITGIFVQGGSAGYSLSDVDCSSGTCVSQPYGHIFVFTYNRPRAEPAMTGVSGKVLEIGDDLAWVSGGVGEFLGYTELNFPQTVLVDEAPDEAFLPAPVTLDGAWLLSPQAMVNLEQNESGLVEIVGGRVCPLDDEWDRFGQWKLDVGNGCGSTFNVISDAVPSFDPAAHTDQVLPRVVGTLRGINISDFHVWIVQPRRDGDIVLN